MLRAGISGIGVVSALGRTAEETRSALFSGNPVRPARPTRFDTALSLPVFELPEPAIAEPAGLPLRFLLTALEEALKDAGLAPELFRTRKVGVAVGTTVACQLDSIPCHERLRRGDLGDLSPVKPYVTGLPAEYLRRKLNLNGPAVTVSNACASGADAVLIGLDWIRTGLCDLVIAAGCDSVSKVAFNGFNALRVCSPAPCRPFDSERAGLNLGDAAGVVILESPESAALRGIRIDYELGGAGKTADAFHITQPESTGTELERAVRTALREAELSPAEIDFINAHGTGTKVNDRVESSVILRVFGDSVPFQSTKSMTGHTLGAAGTIELIFTLLMLREKRAAASRGFERPGDDIPVSPLKNPVPIQGRAAVSTSLAFGGSNTALVLRRLRPSGAARPPKDIFISGFRFPGEGEPDRAGLTELCRKYGLRRPDRLTQMALFAADALSGFLTGKGGETGLITVTSYGPSGTTCRVLDDILDYPEEEILPTGFSHSVVNATSSCIGTALKIHGPTFALAGFEDPFHEAVGLAGTLISAGRCGRVLVVAADEKSITSDAVETLRRSSIPRFREGSCAMLLSGNPSENRFGKLVPGETENSERLLSCGIPAELPGLLAAAAPDRTVRLNRLPEPVWDDGFARPV